MKSENHPSPKEQTKQYIETKLVVPQGIEDQLSSFLIDLGSMGTWFEPVGEDVSVIGYLPSESETQVVRKAILDYLDGLRELGFQFGKGKINLQKIEIKNWAEEWKKSFKPIFVTVNIVVLPEWDKSEFPGKIVIRIKPGMAFGTGDHATTQLSIRALSRFVKPGNRIIDVGCGSGILSILSAKLGGAYALGLDIDQDAMNDAEENLILNQVEDVVEIRQGTAHAGIPPASFDVAVANINRIEIVESFDKIEPLVKGGGTLIFSGILDVEEGYMTDFLKRQRLKDIEVERQEEWVCFVGRKQNK
jgi:ribosomal protein L11 methyltransferase